MESSNGPLDETRALLQRYQRGDRDALNALFERYRERVERIARVRTGPALLARASVDDVVQESLLEAFKSIDSYEPREDARFIDWLARVVQLKIANMADYWQAEKRRPEYELHPASQPGTDANDLTQQLAADSTGVSERASRREQTQLVDGCLAELSRVHREVILLREYAGGDWAWIAAQLGSPNAHAVQQLYQRARETLRAKVRQRTET